MDKEHQPKAYWAMINFVTISKDIRKYGIDLKLDEKYYSKTLCDYICNVRTGKFYQSVFHKESILQFIELPLDKVQWCDIGSKEIVYQLLQILGSFRLLTFGGYSDAHYKYKMPKVGYENVIVDYNTFAFIVDTLTNTMIKPKEHQLVAFELVKLKLLLNFYDNLRQHKDNLYCVIEADSYNDIDAERYKILEQRADYKQIQYERKETLIKQHEEWIRQTFNLRCNGIKLENVYTSTLFNDVYD